jgi:DNA-damage-inducible protein D
MENTNLIPFEGNEIRKIWHNEEWHFSAIDVIGFLTDSKDPSNYWTMLKKRDSQLSTICGKFKFLAPDGKMRPTDCANTTGILRIVMSVPSPKAEPLKLWLAQVGTERIQETENPELNFERMKEIYKAKGYSDEWIERRVQSIETRKQLTGEWKNRGVKEGEEYSILTAQIAKTTFGLNPTEHKDLKGLKKTNQNLRDHMTPLELIFTALSEEATRTIAIRDDAQGFEDNHEAARKGGEGAKMARENFEKTTGVKVVSHQNYLDQPKNKDILGEGEMKDDNSI